MWQAAGNQGTRLLRGCWRVVGTDGDPRPWGLRRGAFPFSELPERLKGGKTLKKNNKKIQTKPKSVSLLRAQEHRHAWGVRLPGGGVMCDWGERKIRRARDLGLEL